MTIQTLINKIRPKLGDPDGRKFPDTRIIEVINEGLQDLGRNAGVKKQTKSYPITPYQRKLIISDPNFYSLSRVRCDGANVPMYTHREMDRSFGKWENKIGTRLEGIVYDMENPKELILYPLLDETESTYEALNNNTAGTLLIDIPNVSADSVYGLITSIDAEDVVIPENVYDETELLGYEPILSVSDTFITIELKYLAIPDQLAADADLSTVVDLDDSYELTLYYYVAGVLLLDDNRTENIQKAGILLDKYKKAIVKDKGRNSNSYQGADYPEVNYRTGF